MNNVDYASTVLLEDLVKKTKNLDTSSKLLISQNYSNLISDEVDDMVTTNISTAASYSAFSPSASTTFISSKYLVFLTENQKFKKEDKEILRLNALMPDLSQDENIYKSIKIAANKNNKVFTSLFCHLHFVIKKFLENKKIKMYFQKIFLRIRKSQHIKQKFIFHKKLVEFKIIFI